MDEVPQQPSQHPMSGVPEGGPYPPSFLRAATLLLTWTVQRQLAQERRAVPAGVDPEGTFYQLLANTKEPIRPADS